MRNKLFSLFMLFMTIFVLAVPFVLAQSADPATPSAATTVAAKVIGICVAASAVIQVVKKIFPNVHGIFFVILNVAAAATGTIALASPQELTTFGFWGTMVMSVLATAGVHDLAGFVGLFKSKSQLTSGS